VSSPGHADPRSTGRDPFVLDPFQREAIAVVERGDSVLVAAPTGAGKTIVAERAIDRMLDRGARSFYTTPIKALSNQKYHDFVVRYGATNVGLLTGDNVVNGEAPVVVMTTEVLRNMLYASSPSLANLGCVVLDEVHYLQDPYRGPVWEEVIVHTAPGVQFVCLSATVSNAEELGSWLRQVRGPTGVVVSELRPVELANLYLVGDATAPDPQLVPILVGGEPNPEGARFDADPRRDRASRGDRPRRRWYTPSRREMLERLRADEMLPAICFIFSRAACDDAVSGLVGAGVRLTSPVERREIHAIVERRTAALRPGEREAVGYTRFLAGIEAGVAAHHAGLIPAFKESVEECFAAGLVKLVFATETLALGINMPARATVIERLTKFNGDSHQFLTPLEYTQLTGRAGRRGIDTIGYAVVLWSPFATFEQVADLASSRAFPLTSVFRPTYNMAANLVARHERTGAHRLLGLSFGQYQRDAAVVAIEARLRDEQARLERSLAAAACEHGDVVDYLRRRAEAAAAPDKQHTALALAGLERLRPGQVISVPGPRGAEPAAVLSVSYRSGGRVKLRVVTGTYRRATLGPDDFDTAPEVIGSVELPEPYRPNNGGFQHEVARRVQRARLRRNRRRRPAAPVEIDHPVLACPDLAAHLGPAADALRRQDLIEHLAARRTRQRATLARQFDDIVGILSARGYIADWRPNPRANLLMGIFHECDLAVAEALRQGLFDGLRPPELAALASCFTYEHRGPGTSHPPRLRGSDLRQRFQDVERIARDLQAEEREAGLSLTRSLDPGFAALAYGWAAGERLDELLDLGELTGGDFVRQMRQLIDLLGQIGAVAPLPATAAAARAAAGALQRGVVAASGTLDDTLSGHADREG
jgi:ATP-dependent RNA helicase HelY